MDKCQGLTGITKRDIYGMFRRAWDASFKSSTILKAFEVTGLSPFNTCVILDRFNSKDIERPSSSKSSSSVVDNIYNKRSQKLSQTIHSISARNNLLQHEN
ncbi:hypothetical protein K432DRAFT_471993 [Lepidopterella palustris CBS 459.81]|uniref:Uncharacterized protein n=1 Tax=Lepidopterella palustris CBS 459.81 TaxID=1314670 RepID=A0A8E2EEV8_9PEZI|nr:hypothetical protein K432DRAFT_471993 [Lepidopterella palustris CBS 459.81]